MSAETGKKLSGEMILEAMEYIDDALIEGLSQNQNFFSLLLSNDEMKKEVLGIFVSEIYKSLREDK